MVSAPDQQAHATPPRREFGDRAYPAGAAQAIRFRPRRRSRDRRPGGAARPAVRRRRRGRAPRPHFNASLLQRPVAECCRVKVARKQRPFSEWPHERLQAGRTARSRESGDHDERMRETALRGKREPLTHAGITEEARRCSIAGRGRTLQRSAHESGRLRHDDYRGCG